MKHTPVRLASCRRIRDCLTGAWFLAVGVLDARGKLVEQVYEVRAGAVPGTFLLLKPDAGDWYKVDARGCDCNDKLYRKRPDGDCKHQACLRLAGWLPAKESTVLEVMDNVKRRPQAAGKEEACPTK